MKNVLILDNHPLFLQGVVSLFNTSYPNVKAIAVDNFVNAQQNLTKKTFDLLLFSLKLSEQHYLKLFIQQFPSLPIIIITTSNDKNYINTSLNYGVKDYLLKTHSKAKFINTINKVFSIKKIQPINCKIKHKLTPRQYEVLTLVSQGLTNQSIADILFIAIGTVKQHLHNIFKNLNVRTRIQAIQYLTKF